MSIITTWDICYNNIVVFDFVEECLLITVFSRNVCVCVCVTNNKNVMLRSIICIYVWLMFNDGLLYVL